MTQDQVAEIAGLTPQTVSSAERGTKALRPENIVKLCQVLNVTPNDLLLETAPELLSDKPSTLLSKLSPQKRRYLEELIHLFMEAMLQEE